MLSRAINTAWMLLCRLEARAFDHATRDVAAAQAEVLNRIVAQNRGTKFGREHGFETLRSPRDFQERVPASTCDDYRDAIHRIGLGEGNVLTAEPVELLEPPSGTSSAEKLVPYTKTLRLEFQRALAAWIYDLFRSDSAIRAGRAYWSISPAFGAGRRTPGGTPIGFEDDAAYLGGIERAALGRILVRPPGIARVHEMDAFRYLTLLWLLRADDLSLISIWSPTFLTALLEGLGAWGERLIRDLHDGSVSPPAELDSSIHAKLRAAARADPGRSRAIERALADETSTPEKMRKIWPRLALISCWADAAATGPAAQLQSLFPTVRIQPKGLLATEGCVSIPLCGCDGAALALRSHFLEFEESAGGEPGEIRMAHELALGGRYQVMITTGGGLYRYRLHDEIEVTGFYNRCPLVRFVGRADHVSDLAGEKLSEIQVREALNR